MGRRIEGDANNTQQGPKAERIVMVESLLTRNRASVLFAAFTIMFCVSILPMEVVRVQSSTMSNCPSDAMTLALPISMQVNQEKLPNLNSNSTDQQIASEINSLD